MTNEQMTNETKVSETKVSETKVSETKVAVWKRMRNYDSQYCRWTCKNIKDHDLMCLDCVSWSSEDGDNFILKEQEKKGTKNRGKKKRHHNSYKRGL